MWRNLNMFDIYIENETFDKVYIYNIYSLVFAYKKIQFPINVFTQPVFSVYGYDHWHTICISFYTISIIYKLQCQCSVFFGYQLYGKSMTFIIEFEFGIFHNKIHCVVVFVNHNNCSCTHRNERQNRKASSFVLCSQIDSKFFHRQW